MFAQQVEQLGTFFIVHGRLIGGLQRDPDVLLARFAFDTAEFARGIEMAGSEIKMGGARFHQPGSPSGAQFLVCALPTIFRGTWLEDFNHGQMGIARPNERK
jgi:hypothetical protein